MPIAESLISKGFEVIIGYGELGGVNPNFLERKGFKTDYVPMQRGGTNLLKDIKTFCYIWCFFKKVKPNIVHLVSIKPYLYGGIIARLAGIPSVVSAISGLGSLFIRKDIKSHILRFLLYPLYKFAFNHHNQCVIVQNKDDAKVLIRWGVLNRKKVRLIKGSGIQLNKFLKHEETKGELVVCFVARLIRDKGVYDFISAVRLLKERGVRAQFCLVGDLDTNNPTGLNLDDLNIIKKQGYVKILGYQKNITKVYSKSHIICLPSYREGFPKTLIEAAAASRAVVTTDVPGCRDAIIPNKTGLLVPLKNPQKLANALQWLIEHPKERIVMGKAGRKFAEKEFPIEKIVQSHLNIYQELISKVI